MAATSVDVEETAIGILVRFAACPILHSTKGWMCSSQLRSTLDEELGAILTNARSFGCRSVAMDQGDYVQSAKWALLNQDGTVGTGWSQ